MVPAADERALPSSAGQRARGGRRAVQGQRLDGTTFWLLSTFAVLSAVAVVVLAVDLRIVDAVGEASRLTVVEAFGPRGWVAALVPLVGAGVVVPLCVVARRRDGRGARTAARIAATSLLAVTVVATVTILVGIIAVPSAATLAGIAWSRSARDASGMKASDSRPPHATISTSTHPGGHREHHRP